MARIWITRAWPGAETTAEALRRLGHEPFVAPLLEARDTGEGPVDLDGVGALAFTSANAVRAFARRMAPVDLPVFAVGEATARAAREAGLTGVSASGGGVETLAALILQRRDKLGGGEVLHPAAGQLAGDLAGALRAGGVAARMLVVYETRPRTLATEELAQISAQDIVLVHSAKAAGELARQLAAHPAPRLEALGLSEAALRPLAQTPLAARRAAARPAEAALLELIGQTP